MHKLHPIATGQYQNSQQFFQGTADVRFAPLPFQNSLCRARNDPIILSQHIRRWDRSHIRHRLSFKSSGYFPICLGLRVYGWLTFWKILFLWDRVTLILLRFVHVIQQLRARLFASPKPIRHLLKTSHLPALQNRLLLE